MMNAYAQYKNQSLSMMTQGELLVKLFDEIIKQCHLAQIGLEKQDYIGANNSLTKSQSILSTLAESLDMIYPISQELHDMYIFFAQQLARVGTEKNASLIDGLLPLLKDLRDSFEQADKLSRSRQSVGGQAV